MSRGGEKLAAALAVFVVAPAGLSAASTSGASTGGFTDCLLQAGAREVCAVDVGRGQLHERLRQDERVVVVDGVNARALTRAQLPFAAAFAVIDVSFISLGLVLPAVLACLAAPWRCLPLVKPQFEAAAARRREGWCGIRRSGALRSSASSRSSPSRSSYAGRVLVGLPGPAGNREFFLHVVSSDHPDAAQPPRDLDARLDRAVASSS